MLPLFDIFQLQQDHSLRWLEASDTLPAAQARIVALAESSPGKYVILNQQTGQKIVVDASRAKKSATSS